MFRQDQTPVMFYRSFSLALFSLSELVQTELSSNHYCGILICLGNETNNVYMCDT